MRRNGDPDASRMARLRRHPRRDHSLSEDEQADLIHEARMTKTVLIARLIICAVALVFVPWLSSRAGQDENRAAKEWVDQYSAGPYSCCLPEDTVFLEPWRVAGLRVGDYIIVKFPNGTFNVHVKKIYQTRDPKGRALITRWGCVFRSFGS
jgi:hypothetical protein